MTGDLDPPVTRDRARRHAALAHSIAAIAEMKAGSSAANGQPAHSLAMEAHHGH